MEVFDRPGRDSLLPDMKREVPLGRSLDLEAVSHGGGVGLFTRSSRFQGPHQSIPALKEVSGPYRDGWHRASPESARAHREASLRTLRGESPLCAVPPLTLVDSSSSLSKQKTQYGTTWEVTKWVGYSPFYFFMSVLLLS